MPAQEYHCPYCGRTDQINVRPDVKPHCPDCRLYINGEVHEVALERVWRRPEVAE